MKGEKIYLQPMDMIMNAIHDLTELQKGEPVLCDTPGGRIDFRVGMYASVWEYRFSVTDIGRNRCCVSIELAEADPINERLISHEFALLDYMLIDRARIEYREIAEDDRRILDNKKGNAREVK